MKTRGLTLLESQPSEQTAASVSQDRILLPQRISLTILATMFAISTLVFLLAGLVMAAEIIRGDLKTLKTLPVAAVMGFNCGALSYVFFHGRGLPTWFLRSVWTQLAALMVWCTISVILKFLRGGDIDLNGCISFISISYLFFYLWIPLFKTFRASK